MRTIDRRSLFTVAAGLLAVPLALSILGCAPFANMDRKIRAAPGADFSRFRVLGVLPFRGQGPGRELAEGLCLKLEQNGFETSDMDVLVKEFARTKPDELGMTMYQLAMIRQTTRAEVLILVRVSKKTFSIQVMDTQAGDQLLGGTFPDKEDGYTPEEINASILGLLTAK